MAQCLRLLPLGIALVGLVLDVVVDYKMAPTIDEADHILYGEEILRGTADRAAGPFFSSKMPISALNALPVELSVFFTRHGWVPGLAPKLKDIRVARLATIVAMFGMSFLIYFYAKSLYGRVSGLFAQLLFILSPNIIAHGTLATTDLYVALCTLLFLWYLRRFLLEPTNANAARTAAVLALAQLTKFSAAYLYLVLALVLVSFALYSRYGSDNSYRVPLRRIAIVVGLNAVFFLIFINAGFLFDRTFTSLSRYQFTTTAFKRLQEVPILRSLPLPIPYPLLQGLDWMGRLDSTGEDRGNLVLLGQLRGKQLARSDSFPAYYLVAYALKEPLGLQYLFWSGVILAIRRRRFPEFLVAEWPLLATIAVLMAMFSLANNTQIGIRHILPVLAICVVLAGGAFATFVESSWWQKTLLCACVLYVAVSVASYFPHMIPYFNEIVHDRRTAYYYLADSNLDWDQDLWVVDAFLKKNPGVVLDPPEPVTGRVLVRGNLMAGMVPPKADYWLRQRALKPVAQVGYGHFLFQVPANGPNRRVATGKE